MIQRLDPSARLSTNRFQLMNNPMDSNRCLLVVDYMWWADNEREIMNWMQERLPRGIEHLEGMVLVFENDFDRINFLMKWGP